MRTTPYTEEGIKRVKCFRCQMPATRQWDIYCDGPQFVAVCDECDMVFNDMLAVCMEYMTRKKNPSYSENQPKGSVMDQTVNLVVKPEDLDKLIKQTAVQAAVTALVGVAVTGIATYFMGRIQKKLDKNTETPKTAKK